MVVVMRAPQNVIESQKKSEYLFDGFSLEIVEQSKITPKTRKNKEQRKCDLQSINFRTPCRKDRKKVA